MDDCCRLVLPYNAVHSIQQTEQIPNDPPQIWKAETAILTKPLQYSCFIAMLLKSIAMILKSIAMKQEYCNGFVNMAVSAFHTQMGAKSTTTSNHLSTFDEHCVIGRGGGCVVVINVACVWEGGWVCGGHALHV